MLHVKSYLLIVLFKVYWIRLLWYESGCINTTFDRCGPMHMLGVDSYEIKSFEFASQISYMISGKLGTCIATAETVIKGRI